MNALRHLRWGCRVAAASGVAAVQLANRREGALTEGAKPSLDCKHKVCKGRMESMQKAFQSARSSVQSPKSTEVTEGKLGASAALVAAVVARCPVDKDQLGEGTWALLHTLAAHFPEAPSTEDQAHLQQFYESLARFYPCPICAADFQQSVRDNPPAAQSRDALVLWTCWLHNQVNAKLGKDVHPCSLEELDRRWLDGGEPCSDNDDE